MPRDDTSDDRDADGDEPLDIDRGMDDTIARIEARQHGRSDELDGVEKEDTDESPVEESERTETAEGEDVRRIPAKQATGTVTVLVRDNSVAVPEDTVVTTSPSEGDPVYRYRITETRYANQGEAIVRNVPIVACVSGVEHNIGAGRITQFENDQAGLEAVRNTQPITGGVCEETDAEFIARGDGSIEGYSAAGVGFCFRPDGSSRVSGMVLDGGGGTSGSGAPSGGSSGGVHDECNGSKRRT
jgi:hypothetical protein